MSAVLSDPQRLYPGGPVELIHQVRYDDLRYARLCRGVGRPRPAVMDGQCEMREKELVIDMSCGIHERGVVSTGYRGESSSVRMSRFPAATRVASARPSSPFAVSAMLPNPT